MGEGIIRNIMRPFQITKLFTIIASKNSYRTLIAKFNIFPFLNFVSAFIEEPNPTF